jgi:hypothetical protein
MAQVVDRGELAGEIVGLGKTGGGGGDKTDFLGHDRQRREQRQRLEQRDAAMRLAARRLDVSQPHVHAVGEEHRIEFRRLGGAREIDEVLELVARQSFVTAPGGDVDGL